MIMQGLAKQLSAPAFSRNLICVVAKGMSFLVDTPQSLHMNSNIITMKYANDYVCEPFAFYQKVENSITMHRPTLSLIAYRPELY
jgi:hypothetical protein